MATPAEREIQRLRSELAALRSELGRLPSRAARTTATRPMLRGVLDDALAAGGITNPTTATLSVYRLNAAGTALIDSGRDVTVTNYTVASAPPGTYVEVQLVEGEWTIFWVDC